MNDLDTALLAAHAAEDKLALVELYTAAADAAQDDEARGFFLTHAYVFALEIDAPDALRLKKTLTEMGRETP